MQRRELMSTLVAAGAGGAFSTRSTATARSSGTPASIAKAADTHFIQANDGTRLYWTQWGAGRPILFLNSAGMTTQMWDYQMVALADQGHRCIAFDRRGHGRSDRPVDGYEYDTFADDIASIIAALDLQELTVVAHSMGGGEIVRYLTRHGGARVARVVLLSPTTPFLPKTADNPNGVPQAAFEALRASWRKDYPRWIAENTAPFFVPETSTSMMQWVAGLLMQCPVPIAIACNKAAASTDFRTELTKLSMPTLVIHGDRDVSAPLALTGKPTAELIPGCRLKVYPGAPHGLMYTHMEVLNGDILQFIRDT
jgi:pimeloyl-ACP methyl ester carboxylesterase